LRLYLKIGDRLKAVVREEGVLNLELLIFDCLIFDFNDVGAIQELPF